MTQKIARFFASHVTRWSEDGFRNWPRQNHEINHTARVHVANREFQGLVFSPSRSQYGRYSNGSGSILGAILETILNLQLIG